MIELEVRGALNVVEACSNAAVKRLVLTSSLSAMVWDRQRNAGTEGAYNSCIDEKCWSNLDFCRAKKVCLLSTAAASHLPKCVCVCVCVSLSLSLSLSLSSPPSPALPVQLELLMLELVLPIESLEVRCQEEELCEGRDCEFFQT